MDMYKGVLCEEAYTFSIFDFTCSVFFLNGCTNQSSLGTLDTENFI